MEGEILKKATLLVLLIILSLTLSACGKSEQETAQQVSADPVATVSGIDSKNQQSIKTPQSSAPEVQQPQIDYAFTQEKQHPEKLLIDVISGAKSSLDISIYSLTSQDILTSIIDAKKRGVVVRIITDQQESKTKTQAEKLKQLQVVGIPVKYNTHKGLMHLKVTVSDKSIVTTGSFNYSDAAVTINDEVLLVIHDAKIAQDWSTEFEKMWNDKTNFQDLK